MYTMQLYMNNQLIERVSSVKFLGIWISANLTWNVHVDHICKKARKIIGFLHRSFQNAPLSIHRSIHRSCSSNLGLRFHNISPIKPTALNPPSALLSASFCKVGISPKMSFYLKPISLFSPNVVTLTLSAICTKSSIISAPLPTHSGPSTSWPP